LTNEELVRQISGGFGQGVVPTVDKDNVVVQLPSAQVLNFARYARDQLGLDMITSITAVDDGETFELLYHFVSVKPLSRHTIQPTFAGYVLARVTVPKDEEEPIVPSITSLYPGANQQEREIFDLMGIRFKGHPRLDRILLWDGFPGHPLRKDWQPLNAEIPWHLAGMTGFGGGTLENAPAVARIAEDGSGISQPIPVGTTPQAFNRPHSRPAKPNEVMRLKIGQNGLVDDEGPEGPASGYGAAPELGRPTPPALEPGE
jgi:NADH-quinone oxidoreductase subunit C